VRFFGGTLDGVTCGAADFVARAYATGTPMGGDLGAVRGSASPRFAVLAMKDPGTAADPGVDLQRVQIIKGWVDPDGTPARAGRRRRGQSRERRERRPGHLRDDRVGRRRALRRLGGPRVRSDPARVLLRARPREPGLPLEHAPLQAGRRRPVLGRLRRARRPPRIPAFADCCLAGNGTDRFLTPTVQERAWTSPIWYRPEAIARLRAAAVVRKARR
jgi:hypothetical protein